MKTPISPQGFTELLGIIDIANVLLTRMDFKVEEGCTIPLPYEVQMSRDQPVHILTDDQICGLIGFQIVGVAEEKQVFIGHFHFQVVFTHNDKEKVETLLSDEKIRELFLGSQLDKFVWSYLRRAIQQVVLDAGFPPVMLPMYR